MLKWVGWRTTCSFRKFCLSSKQQQRQNLFPKIADDRNTDAAMRRKQKSLPAVKMCYRIICLHLPAAWRCGGTSVSCRWLIQIEMRNVPLLPPLLERWVRWVSLDTVNPCGKQYAQGNATSPHSFNPQLCLRHVLQCDLAPHLLHLQALSSHQSSSALTLLRWLSHLSETAFWLHCPKVELEGWTCIISLFSQPFWSLVGLRLTLPFHIHVTFCAARDLYIHSPGLWILKQHRLELWQERTWLDFVCLNSLPHWFLLWTTIIFVIISAVVVCKVCSSSSGLTHHLSVRKILLS